MGAAGKGAELAERVKVLEVDARYQRRLINCFVKTMRQTVKDNQGDHEKIRDKVDECRDAVVDRIDGQDRRFANRVWTLVGVVITVMAAVIFGTAQIMLTLQGNHTNDFHNGSLRQSPAIESEELP